MAQNKHEFASPTITSGAYTGDLAKPYVHALVKSAKTIADGNVTLLEGVRYRAQIPVITTSNLIQAGACDFDDSTSATVLTDIALEVKDLMINLQLCKGQFRTWWEGSPYNNNNSVPSDYADALIGYVSAQAQETIENNIWQGDVDGGGSYALFEGLVPQFATNGGTVGTLGSSINAVGTVIAGLGEAVAEMPSALIGMYDECNLYVNPKTVDLYNLAIGQLGGGYNNATADGGLQRFGGYKMIPTTGLAEGYIVTARAQDLTVGVGSADSIQLAQVIDMTAVDGSDNYRITMRFAVGTQVAVHVNISVQKS